MRKQRFVDEARTAPKYRMFNCGTYPAMVESSENGIEIEGEVWEVDHECLEHLDVVEGVRENLYVRRQVELASPFGRLRVEAYLFQRSVAGLPDCGSLWDMM
jgi:gamma-glutamylaminecyclotransferase